MTIFRSSCWITLAAASAFFTTLAAAQESVAPLNNGPVISSGVLGVADAMSARGGIDNGSRLLGKLEGKVTFDFGRRGLLFLDVGLANGRMVSADLSGDAQGPSNIEGPRSARIYNFLYQLPLDDKDAVLRAGVIDLNAFFYVQGDAAGNFLNGSHGIGPEASHSGRNGPSVYPNTGLALVLEQPMSASATLRLGIFDGVPNDPDRPKRTSFRLRGDEGALVIGELDYRNVMLGGWAYTAKQDLLDGSGAARTNGGVYANTNGEVARWLQAWATMGASASRFNDVDRYLGVGVFAALSPTLSVGAAFASAHVTNVGRETNLELTAPLLLSPNLAIQPNFQFIRNAYGERRNVRVFGVRLSYQLDSSGSALHTLTSGRGRILRKKSAGALF